MSESESDLELKDSIIHTRRRRANAGNRMKALLATVDPRDDEDDENEIFKEVANDGEFDMVAYKQVKKEAGASDFSSDSEISEDDKDLDEGERQLLKQQRQAQRDQRRKDREKMFKIKEPTAPRPAKKKRPQQTAEDTIMHLMADTRRSSQRRSAIDNKRQTIERLRANERKRSEYVVPVYRKKPKLTQAQRLAEAKITEQKNTASLHNFVEMEEQRKHAQRMAMLGKRHRLTNFIRYVSSSIYEYPVPTEAPAIQYNGYSYQSSSTQQSAYSTLPSSTGSTGATTAPTVAPATPAAPSTYQYNPRGQLYAGLDDDSPKKPNGQLAGGSGAQLGGQLRGGQLSGNGGQLGGQLRSQLTSQSDNQSHDSNKPDISPQSDQLASKPATPNDDAKTSTPTSVSPPSENTTQGEKEITLEPESDTGDVEKLNEPVEDVAMEEDAPEPEVKDEDAMEDVEPLEKEKEQPRDNQREDEQAKDTLEKEPATDEKAAAVERVEVEPEPQNLSGEIRDCSGPPAIRCFNGLTLEEFTHPVNNKQAIKAIILGENNVKAPSFPPKRICPFTGEIAKYVDPKTGLAYLNIHIYRLIKRIVSHEYVWSSGAGGVYTQPWKGQRHAKGVPPGFINEKELPKPEKKTEPKTSSAVEAPRTPEDSSVKEEEAIPENTTEVAEKTSSEQPEDHEKTVETAA